jgi:hypothetical protein
LDDSTDDTEALAAGESPSLELNAKPLLSEHEFKKSVQNASPTNTAASNEEDDDTLAKRLELELSLREKRSVAQQHCKLVLLQSISQQCRSVALNWFCELLLRHTSMYNNHAVEQTLDQLDVWFSTYLIDNQNKMTMQSLTQQQQQLLLQLASDDAHRQSPNRRALLQQSNSVATTDSSSIIRHLQQPTSSNSKKQQRRRSKASNTQHRSIPVN